MNFVFAILAALSIWDYPARFPEHDRLRRQFTQAVREGDTETMEETCRKGVNLLPDDPTWHYNLACSLAYFPKRSEEAFDELEKAIDMGFRDVDAIAADTDLKRLEKKPRYGELVEYARQMSTRPMLFGPMATVAAAGVYGSSVALGEQNLSWDFDVGCFVAKLNMVASSAGGNVGDLYMNRDAGHSMIKVEDFPGLTAVKLDYDGRSRGMDLNYPNILFPMPVFGNSSRAFTKGAYWRSIPRALMTINVERMRAMVKFYLSNQTWVYPANADIAPVGTNGDVFASITPYWITTAGRSYSDLPYLRAALEASRSFKPAVKKEIVRRSLLAPTIQTLIRKSLKGVDSEEKYLTALAHPTAFPPNGVDTNRLKRAAAALAADEVPPLAIVSVKSYPPKVQPVQSELTYASAFAWAFVLRAPDQKREFFVSAKGGSEYEFRQTHGAGVKVAIEKVSADSAKITIDRGAMSPTNRVDVAVFARGRKGGWGAPSYISFAVVDPDAPYSDPALTPLKEAAAK
jgi:hypothetical protein